MCVVSWTLLNRVFSLEHGGIVVEQLMVIGRSLGPLMDRRINAKGSRTTMLVKNTNHRVSPVICARLAHLNAPPGPGRGDGSHERRNTRGRVSGSRRFPGKV